MACEVRCAALDVAACLGCHPITRSGLIISNMQIPNYRSLLLILLLASCFQLAENARASSAEADGRFATLADDFISGYLAWRPGNGTALGLHEYDGKLT